MDKPTKEYFHTWAQDNNWLLIGEGNNPQGFPQESFLTPAGQLVFVVWDMEGNLRQVAITMPVPAPAPMPPQHLPPNLRGDLTGGNALWPRM